MRLNMFQGKKGSQGRLPKPDVLLLFNPGSDSFLQGLFISLSLKVFPSESSHGSHRRNDLLGDGTCLSVSLLSTVGEIGNQLAHDSAADNEKGHNREDDKGKLPSLQESNHKPCDEHGELLEEGPELLRNCVLDQKGIPVWQDGWFGFGLGLVWFGLGLGLGWVWVWLFYWKEGWKRRGTLQCER